MSARPMCNAKMPPAPEMFLLWEDPYSPDHGHGPVFFPVFTGRLHTDIEAVLCDKPVTQGCGICFLESILVKRLADGFRCI